MNDILWLYVYYNNKQIKEPFCKLLFWESFALFKLSIVQLATVPTV